MNTTCKHVFAAAISAAVVFAGLTMPVPVLGKTVKTYSEVSEIARELYSKAQTLSGVYYCVEEEHVGGSVQLKVGKINTRTGAVKVTATLNPFYSGSTKGTATATLYEDDEGYLYGTLPIKYKGVSGVQEVELFIFGDVYEDERGKQVVELYFEGGDEYLWFYSIKTGTMETDKLWFMAEMDWEEMFIDDCYYVAAALGEAPIYVSKGTRWSFDKTPSVKYVKYREGGETWYELAGLDDEAKPNVCGLKLTYTAKTGEFKGSYYIYLTNEECVDCGKKPTLKKLKVSVAGVVGVCGTGYGSATMKVGRQTYSWPVYIFAEEEEEEYEDPDCEDCWE